MSANSLGSLLFNGFLYRTLESRNRCCYERKESHLNGITAEEILQVEYELIIARKIVADKFDDLILRFYLTNLREFT